MSETQTLQTNTQTHKSTTPIPPSTMGSTKPFHHRNSTALNSDNSKMLPSKRDPVTKSTTTTATTKAKPKPILTIQERLQHLSLLHWRQPIDEALDLHLHGRLIFSDSSDSSDRDSEAETLKTFVLNPESWTKWPLNYCKALMNLVPLVSPSRANELLTRKLATAGVVKRNVGAQPWVVREVVVEVMKRCGQKGAAMQGTRKRDGENGMRGGRGRGRGNCGGRGGRGQGGRGKVAK